MTNRNLATVLSTGNGTLDFILQIEGCPFAFATHRRLTTAYDATYLISGSTVYGGLQKDGIRVGFASDLANAVIDGTGQTFSIVDDPDGNITRELTQQPSVVTFLTNNIGPSDLSFNVVSTDGFSAGDYFYIGQEAVLIKTKAATNFTCAATGRGQFISQPKGWFAFRPGEALNQSVEITNRPASLIGRRIKVFGFGLDETPATVTDANILIRGMIASEPSLKNGVLWTIQCKPITDKLKQRVFQNLDQDFKPRGIYHPPRLRPTFFFAERVATTQNIGGGLWGVATNTVATSFMVTASQDFFEDKYSFLADLSASLGYAIATNAAAGEIKTFPLFEFGPSGDLRITFALSSSANGVGAGEVRYLEAQCQRGMQEPYIRNFGGDFLTKYRLADFINISDVQPDRTFFVQVDPRSPVDTTGNGVAPLPDNFLNVATIDTYADQRMAIVNKSQENNDICIPFPDVVSPLFGHTYGLVTDDDRRLYLAPSVPGWGNALGIETTFLVNPRNGTREFVESTGRIDLPIASIDTANNYVVYTSDAAVLGSIASPHLLGNDVDLNLSAEIVTDGDFLNFISYITGSSPASSSLGIFPDLTADDIYFDRSNLIGDDSGTPTYLSSRNYTFYQDYSLEDIFAPELQLLGWFMTVDLSGSNAGKLTFKPWKIANPISGTQLTVSKSNALTQGRSGQYWQLNRQSEKFYNELVMRADLNAQESQYGLTINAKYLPSIGRYGTINKFLIEPKSRENLPLTENDLTSVSGRVFSQFSLSRNTWSGRLPLNAYNKSFIGNDTIIDLSQMPNSSGTRGNEVVAGLIKSITWDFAAGYGDAEIVINGINQLGYSPSLAVDYVSERSGSLYTFKVDHKRFTKLNGNSSLNDVDWFKVGDKIELRQLNTLTPFRLTGSISTIDATNDLVAVLFGGVPTNAQLLAMSGSRINYQSYTGSLGTNQNYFTYIYSGSIDGPLGVSTINKNIII